MVQTYVEQDFVLFVNKFDPKIKVQSLTKISSFTVSLFSLCNSTKPKLLYASA